MFSHSSDAFVRMQRTHRRGGGGGGMLLLLEKVKWEGGDRWKANLSLFKKKKLGLFVRVSRKVKFA